MNNQRKYLKICQILITIVMCITLLLGVGEPISASSATSGKCGDNLNWKYDASSKTLTISGSGDMYDYVGEYEDGLHAPWMELQIENVVFSKGITSIGSSAFEWSDVRSIDIPEGVVRIGEDAFNACHYARILKLPSTLKTIEKNAFDAGYFSEVHCPSLEVWCNYDFINIGSNPMSSNSGAEWGAELYINGQCITDVIIPEGITVIKPNAFYNYSYMTNVTIPDSVTRVKTYAFGIATHNMMQESSLKNIIFPENVELIEENALYRHFVLEKIVVFNSNCKIDPLMYSTPDRAYYEDAIIYGWPGSTAEQYAANRRYKFVALKEYKVTEGDNSTYTLDSGKTLSIQTEGKMSELYRVTINGKTVKLSNYSVNDSGIVLNNGYLQSLSKGNYTLKVVFETGEAVTKLTVVEAPVSTENEKDSSETQDTGNNSNEQSTEDDKNDSETQTTEKVEDTTEFVESSENVTEETEDITDTESTETNTDEATYSESETQKTETDNEAEPTKKNNIGVGIAAVSAVILVGGGTAAFLILKKRKKG